jgi:hypothetical protein
MKYGYLAFAVCLVSAPIAAAADRDMSDGQYLAASRCVAYAQLPQLSGDAVNVSALQEAVEANRTSSMIRSSARRIAQDVGREASRAGEGAEGVASLRSARDEACSDFAASGLIEASTPQTPAS